jgi:hypothetical protein
VVDVRVDFCSHASTFSAFKKLLLLFERNGARDQKNNGGRPDDAKTFAIEPVPSRATWRGIIGRGPNRPPPGRIGKNVATSVRVSGKCLPIKRPPPPFF